MIQPDGPEERQKVDTEHETLGPVATGCMVAAILGLGVLGFIKLWEIQDYAPAVMDGPEDPLSILPTLLLASLGGTIALAVVAHKRGSLVLFAVPVAALTVANGAAMNTYSDYVAAGRSWSEAAAEAAQHVQSAELLDPASAQPGAIFDTAAYACVPHLERVDKTLCFEFDRLHRDKVSNQAWGDPTYDGREPWWKAVSDPVVCALLSDPYDEPPPSCQE